MGRRESVVGHRSHSKRNRPALRCTALAQPTTGSWSPCWGLCRQPSLRRCRNESPTPRHDDVLRRRGGWPADSPPVTGCRLAASPRPASRALGPAVGYALPVVHCRWAGNLGPRPHLAGDRCPGGMARNVCRLNFYQGSDRKPAEEWRRRCRRRRHYLAAMARQKVPLPAGHRKG